MKKEIKPITANRQTEIARLYNEYYEVVSNHVRRVVKNLHDSEDVTNDVFDKIMRLELVFNPNRGANESTWIFTITNSVILDFFRTNHQEHYTAVSNFVNDGEKEENKVYFQFVAPEQSRADKKILNSELHGRVAKAFRTLKPKYRKIAILYFLRDLPYSEIAKIVNVPMGTVKGMINRSRAKLQNELKGVYTV